MDGEAGEQQMIDEQEEIQPESGPLHIKVITTDEECQQLTEDTTCLVFLQQLLELASAVRQQCETCKSKTFVSHDFVGSALYIKWVSVT